MQHKIWGVVTLGAALTMSCLFSTAIVNAAPAGEKGERQPKPEKLADALGLTDAQKEQLKAILKSAKSSAEAIKADTTLTPEQKHEKLKQLRADTRAKIEAILTPEQLQKLKELKQKRRGERPERKKRPEGKERPEGKKRPERVERPSSANQS